MKKSQQIGIDVGGTKIYIARYDSDLNLQAEIQVPTQADEGRAVVYANIVKGIEQVFTPDVQAIGIAWAGFVDPIQGKVIQAPNIPNWADVPLASDISHHFEVPTFIDNDARLFTLAEQRLGCAQALPNVLGLIIGTGVGSGLVLNNQIYSGTNGFAGEIGHMIANINQSTDLTEAEELFSGPGLGKLFAKNLQIPNFHEVEKRCLEGDQKTIALFESVIDQLAIYIYNLLLAYNPDTVVLGGGVGKNVLPLFKTRLTKSLESLLKAKNYPIHVDIRFSQLTNAGALGAAIYAQERSH